MPGEITNGSASAPPPITTINGILVEPEDMQSYAIEGRVQKLVDVLDPQQEKAYVLLAVAGLGIAFASYATKRAFLIYQSDLLTAARAAGVDTDRAVIVLPVAEVRRG